MKLAGMSPAAIATRKNRPLKPTEALTLVNARVGQGQFRDDLLTSFDGQCAITGLSVTKLIRASHIRPWCECESDEQKLDPNNGLLLAVGVDAAFDCGYITFKDDGSLVVSKDLEAADLARLGIPADGSLQNKHLSKERMAHLKYHREQLFVKRENKSKKNVPNQIKP